MSNKRGGAPATTPAQKTTHDVRNDEKYNLNIKNGQTAETAPGKQQDTHKGVIP